MTASAAELDRRGGHARFTELRVYQRPIEFLALTMDVIAALPKGNAEAAAALDMMRVTKLIDDSRYARGIELLEGIVAMLTKTT